jgi:hypothetical protein
MNIDARSTFGVLVVAIAIVAPSCGDDSDDAGEPSPPVHPTTPAPQSRPSEGKGVVLSLDRDTPHAGETLQLTVKNNTRTPLEYGLAYQLERRASGRWVWINKDAAFALILKSIAPGQREREEVQLPGDLSPGRYRIVKSFNAPETARELDASVEFTVANA